MALSPHITVLVQKRTPFLEKARDSIGEGRSPDSSCDLFKSRRSFHPMKTYIKAPEEAEVRRLNVSPLEEDNPLGPLCDVFENVGTSLGCASEERAAFMDTVCNVINTVMGALGCDPIEPPPPPECTTDQDCEELEICDETGNCVPDPDDCRNFPELCPNPWDPCSEETGQCEADEDHCYYAGCEAWESCDQPSGECEPLETRCNSDEDCPWPSEPDKDICKEVNHICVECLDNNDCDPSGEEYCDPALNTCNDCIVDGLECDYDYQCCPGTTCHDMLGTCEEQ
jgi:hypothetical protein